MRNRAQVLSDLVQLNGDFRRLRDELRQFSWDADEAEFTITFEHVSKVLSLYTNGKIDAAVLEDWANAVEVREDVEYQDDRLKEIIHELANPILVGDDLEKRIETYKKILA